LGWHDDGEERTAAYTFYAHPAWAPEWGGELLIGTKRQDNTGRGTAFRRDDTFDELSPTVAGVCAGVFVVPLPNRLVVIRSGVPHRINRVEMAAGTNWRVSIAGFFTRP
jgi:Rps23 Pro-64 3,4-dihydroxylase Tpa1-like proline 4-hydroxylase